MIKLENVVLASPEQMEFIIEGMRNPMNSWEKKIVDIGMTVTVFIVLIMTIFWMLLQFILPGLNDTLCIIFYYLTMCLLGMWCFYYIGVVMAEMR